jgi:hypothetical protein
MPYEGPDSADLSNVEALNAAYLDWLRGHGGRTAPGVPAALRERIADLDGRRCRHLARAPFLLMSFREHDEPCWRSLFEDRHSADLLARLDAADEVAGRLVAAGLAFLWQLARRNGYAARLVTGAGLAWCERLAESTLVDVLDRAAGQHGLLVPRLGDNERLWSKLLAGGVSPRRDVRIAARVSALQIVLTSSPAAAYGRLPAAACRLPGPTPRTV